jgi:hypothetical protein
VSQLRALVWLKWRLFVNSMRSRRAAVGRAASAAGTLAGLAFSLVFAASLGVGAYFLSAPPAEGFDPVREPALRVGYVFLFFVFTMAFMSWALMPLAVGGGSRFEPARMLLYPVSLRKLFAFDLLSDLTSLVSVFAVPTILALGVGAGLARGMLWAGLLVSLAAAAFGLAASKLAAFAVGSLMRARRTRGEMLLALLGAALGMTGALMGQLLPLAERYAPYLEAARWTPPGAASYGLAKGLLPGGVVELSLSLATLGLYAAVCLLLAYRFARRSALGLGGGGGKRAAAVKVSSPADAGRSDTRDDARRGYAGWRLPLSSPQLSAVFEKELRYAVRNAQLRVIALMAIGLTIVLRMMPAGGTRSGKGFADFTPYAEGAGAVFSVLYIFTLVSPLSTNLFGFDGAGMRALVLAPAPRRLVLFGKNLAVFAVTATLLFAGVLAGGLFFRDLKPGALLFVALASLTYAPLFALFGNWLSLRYPKRVEFGKRMSRSGVAGLLVLPFFVAMLLPPALSVAAAHYLESGAVRYVILGAFAAISLSLYAPLLGRQGRALERLELDILEAVTGRGGEEEERIMG